MPRSGSGAPRRRRLSRSGDFKRVYRDGSSKATRYLVLYRWNRIKRVLKEAFWSSVDRGGAEQDFVLVARASVGQVIEDRGLEGAIQCVEELTDSGGPDEH